LAQTLGKRLAPEKGVSMRLAAWVCVPPRFLSPTPLSLIFASTILAALSGSVTRADDSPVAAARPRPEATSPDTAITLCPSSCPCPNSWVARTANFRIYWCTSEANIRELAASCERLALGARERWLGDAHPAAWTPFCEVVVHPDTNAYVACVGPGSQTTSGCSSIGLDQGRVVLRRIDLRADALDWNTESLPHELMHVVLADRFSQQRISPWADEGIAMLAESPEKLKRRLTELRRAASHGAIYSLSDLVNVRSRPQLAYRDAFNGQSVALVGLLLDWGTPAQCLDFVAASQQKDWQSALRDVYGERSRELERSLNDSIWTEHAARWARSMTSPTPASAQVAADSAPRTRQ
jgi:hypothetical protein